MDDPELGMRAHWFKNTSFEVNLRGKGLIDRETRSWNVASLEEIFVPHDVELIKANQPSIDQVDSFSWKFNRSGDLQ